MKNKNVFLMSLGIVFSMLSCKKETDSSVSKDDFVTFSGKIINPNSDSLIVFNRDGYKKRIKVANGNFKDTLHVKEGKFGFYDGVEQSSVFFKEGGNIQLTLNTDQFDETIVYEGEGSEINNFLAQKSLKIEEVFSANEDIMELDKEAFSNEIEKIRQTLYTFIDENKTLDKAFIEQEKVEVDETILMYVKYYDSKEALKTEFVKGAISPTFSDYENIDGSKTSLSDLKGKYVYIDVWATWCAPCKQETPFLKELEEKYRGKNIEFVSISVDQIQNHDKWVQMVKEKELKGVQLYADNAFDSDFIKKYKINSIPRFILIDPEGKIVSADTYRPSEKEKIESLFVELGI